MTGTPIRRETHPDVIRALLEAIHGAARGVVGSLAETTAGVRRCSDEPSAVVRCTSGTPDEGNSPGRHCPLIEQGSVPVSRLASLTSTVRATPAPPLYIPLTSSRGARGPVGVGAPMGKRGRGRETTWVSRRAGSEGRTARGW
jgi:hypothetical protein